MKRKTKLICGGIASFVALIGLAGFIYIQFFFTLDLSFEPGPIKKVDPAGWQELEIGMTESQVAEVLGEPESKLGRSTFTLGGEEITTPQTWEYDWTIGLSLFGGTHPKSYLVRFDDDGKLASWREPVERRPEQ